MLCWIEVDLDAVADNVRALQAAAQPRQGVTAVVKAQAYGMGASAVANAAVQAGARGAAVARIGEARRLRSAGFRMPILLLGGLDAEDCAEVVASGLTPSLSDWPTAQRLAEEARGRPGARRSGQSRHRHDSLRRAARRGHRHRARPGQRAQPAPRRVFTPTSPPRTIPTRSSRINSWRATWPSVSSSRTMA